MLSFGLFAFIQPWLLLAALALPALWLLLRVTPPAPRRQAFPALRLLLRLESREETPARTPLWLLLLRLAVAGLLIAALAGPLFNPQPRLAGSGPLLIVLDDGWATAGVWSDRRTQLDALLAQVEREDRPVGLLRTAPDATGQVRLERTTATAAREKLPGWRAQPWPVDRAAALRALAELEPGGSVIWLSDGLAGDERALADAGALATRLREIGSLRIFAASGAELPALLRPPELTPEGLAVAALRPAAGAAQTVQARAVGPGGEVLGRTALAFAADATRATARLDLPSELQNRIARLEFQPANGIGGVTLLDERWRRRTAGIVGQQHAEADQPLLSEIYFVQRALAPYATLRVGTIEGLVDAPLSLLVLPDTGRLGAAENEALQRWIEGGGVLLRFAGPRLAAATDDPLVPVKLRSGDRQLGGVLSWSEPLAISRFDPGGPFAGLPPSSEARVSRQILAEPGPGLAAATFASLADGTPLVTGRRLGQGWLVLIHTTANTTWSSLPLSGLFIDMLRRILAMAPGAGGQPTGTLRADAVLDAEGTLHPAAPGLPAVPAAGFGELRVGPTQPPGLYAPATGVVEAGQVPRLALNLQSAVPELHVLAEPSLGAATERYSEGAEVDLGPSLLLVALLLAMVDLLIGFVLRGLVPRFGPAATAAGLAALLLSASPVAAQGQAGDEPRLAAAVETRLAYVLTGRRDVDDNSRAGLEGLGRVLAGRTSVETGDPVGVDIASDELAVYPILYWPVPPDHPDLGTDAVERIEGYLRRGGMILFDTRDAGLLLPGQDGGGPGEQRLSQIMRGIDVPPLTRLPADHVLTRSFYLLQDFPGRWTGQPVWIDQVPASINDGVSGVIIGAHDWAGAWAIDELGQSVLPVVPGGETQREMARRFGINVVMYALTGNYKTDQVHVPALLERLGQ